MSRRGVNAKCSSRGGDVFSSIIELSFNLPQRCGARGLCIVGDVEVDGGGGCLVAVIFVDEHKRCGECVAGYTFGMGGYDELRRILVEPDCCL